MTWSVCRSVVSSQAQSRFSSQAQSKLSSQDQSRLSSQAQCARSIWHSNDNLAICSDPPLWQVRAEAKQYIHGRSRRMSKHRVPQTSLSFTIIRVVGATKDLEPGTLINICMLDCVSSPWCTSLTTCIVYLATEGAQCYGSKGGNFC